MTTIFTVRTTARSALRSRFNRIFRLFFPALAGAAAVLFLFAQAAAGEGLVEKGPVAVQNRFPLHLMYLTPLPESPRTSGAGRLTIGAALDYSSVYVNEASADWSVRMDMELTVLTLSAEYGVADRLDISVRLPLVSMNSGVMDGFLEGFHDLFGLPNYGREDRPDNDFAYDVSRRGRDWFHAASGGLHPADGRMALKWRFWDAEVRSAWFASALSYALKLPIGDKDAGLGSGRFDHGLTLLTSLRIDRFSFYLNPGVHILSDPETMGADVSANNLFTCFLGGEYLWSAAFSLAAQLNFYTAPFSDTGIGQLDDPSLELSLGAVWRMSPNIDLRLAFCEDLTRSAPDFSLHVAMTYRFAN